MTQSFVEEVVDFLNLFFFSNGILRKIPLAMIVKGKSKLDLNQKDSNLEHMQWYIQVPLTT